MIYAYSGLIKTAIEILREHVLILNVYLIVLTVRNEFKVIRKMTRNYPNINWYEIIKKKKN